jgi:hypothetical protein
LLPANCSRKTPPGRGDFSQAVALIINGLLFRRKLFAEARQRHAVAFSQLFLGFGKRNVLDTLQKFENITGAPQPNI